MSEGKNKISKLFFELFEKYDYQWERFKFLGFQQFFASVILAAIVALCLMSLIFYLIISNENIDIQVLVLIVLGVQAVFMFLQTNYIHIQTKFHQYHNSPQIVPFRFNTVEDDVYYLYFRNTKEIEAYNVNYRVRVERNKKEDINKKKFVGTVTSKNPVSIDKFNLTELKKIKITLEFSYRDTTSTIYLSRYLKKYGEDEFLFVGFKPI